MIRLVFVFIFFCAIICPADDIGLPIEVRQSGLSTQYYVLDKRVSFREVRRMLKSYEDSHDEYNRHLRAKFVGLGIVLGLSAAIIPVYLQAERPLAYFITFPISIPATVSGAVQRRRLEEAIRLHNKHIRY